MRMNILGAIGEIDSLPGCTQIAVSHSVFVPRASRSHGLGALANLERQMMAFDHLGYDMMICTVSSDNADQKRILDKNGWTCYTSFISRKTGHAVELWGCRPKENYELPKED